MFQLSARAAAITVVSAAALIGSSVAAALSAAPTRASDDSPPVAPESAPVAAELDPKEAAEAPDGGWVGYTERYPQLDTPDVEGGGEMPRFRERIVWRAWPVTAEDQAGTTYSMIWAGTPIEAQSLLLARSDTDPRLDPSTTVTVVDAVPVDPVDGVVLAVGCTVDGVADPALAVTVSYDLDDGVYVNTVQRAWYLNSTSETIETLHPAEVSCDEAHPIVEGG